MAADERYRAIAADLAAQRDGQTVDGHVLDDVALCGLHHKIDIAPDVNLGRVGFDAVNLRGWVPSDRFMLCIRIGVGVIRRRSIDRLAVGDLQLHVQLVGKGGVHKERLGDGQAFEGVDLGVVRRCREALKIYRSALYAVLSAL